jgi:hypothetical protein
VSKQFANFLITAVQKDEIYHYLSFCLLFLWVLTIYKKWLNTWPAQIQTGVVLYLVMRWNSDLGQIKWCHMLSDTMLFKTMLVLLHVQKIGGERFPWRGFFSFPNLFLFHVLKKPTCIYIAPI